MAPDINHVKENGLVSLKVGQLIYTSFRESGFTLLTSPDIPSLVQQSFIKNLVQTHWDTYHPPSPGYRAAYLHQLPLEMPGALFGWLYHDGHDELGRSDIPYFISYYLPGELQHTQLSLILAALQKGPEAWIDRSDYLLNNLEPLVIENIQHYKPARKGVVFPAQILEESHNALQAQSLLNWFFPDASLTQHMPQYQPVTYSGTNEKISSQLNSVHLEDKAIPVLVEAQSSNNRQESLETDLESAENKTKNLESILNELVSKPIGIQGAVLVSSEGQAITTPIGMDEKPASIMAGTMLYLSKNTQQELNWQNIETVSVKSQQGYMILSNCSDDIYLLIKSEKVPMGLLEGEVNRAITRLSAALNSGKNEPKAETRVNIPNAMVSEQTVIQVQPTPEKTLLIKSDPDSEVTYRGRRISS